MISLERIKRRKLVQWTVAYAASGFAALQLLDMLANRFAWPTAVMRGAIIVIAFGLLITLVVAWYHGEHGQQKFSVSEIALIALIAIAASVSVAFFARPPATKTASMQVAPERGSIAVLPFLDISEDHDQEYFTDGMTEELLNSLAQVVGLRVAARTSTFAFKGKDVAVDSIARVLHVANILEGSVRKSGDKVRISAKLIDPVSGFELWAETYDRQLKDVFAIEEDIASAIASALKVRLVAATGENEPTAAAHDLYLRGRFAFNKQSESSLHEAINYYQKALAVQPNYSVAHVGIAEAYLWLADSFLAPRDAYPKAKKEVMSALEEDPESSEALRVLGAIEVVWDWDGPASRLHLTRALNAAPGSPSANFYYGAWYTVFGPISEGLPWMQKARDLDPYNPFFHGTLATGRYWARDYARALNDFEASEQIDPNFIWLAATHGDALRELKLYDQAIARYRREEAIIGMPSAGLGVTYARMGKKAEALQIAHTLERLSKDRYVAVDRIAAIYANLGDIDKAYELLLGRGMKERDTWMAWIPIMPDFDPIRSDPRYKKLLRQMNLSPN